QGRIPGGAGALTAFTLEARGGISVAVAQVDGTAVDNIVAGSPPGLPSEVKVYRAHLPSSTGTAPPLFSSFSPYPQDQSAVSPATAFVAFSTGRNSIVTAPGPGRLAEVKVFAFSLFAPLAHDGSGAGPAGALIEPITTASFAPFGPEYKSGVSLATG